MNKKVTVILSVCVLTGIVGAMWFGFRDHNSNEQSLGKNTIDTVPPDQIDEQNRIILPPKTVKDPKFIPATNPFVKPEPPPLALVKTLSNALTQAEQLAELDALPRDVKSPEEAQALRWIIHEYGLPEVVRNEAVKVLLARGDSELQEDLVKMLNNTGYTPLWRSYSIQFLQEIYSTTSNDEVLNAIRKAGVNTNSEIRSQAIYSLAQIAHEKEWLTNNGSAFTEVTRFIQDAIKSKESELVVAGLRSASFANISSIAIEAERFSADTALDPKIRVAAVQALGQIGRDESRRILMVCTKDRHRTVRRFAKISLASLGKNSSLK